MTHKLLAISFCSGILLNSCGGKTDRTPTDVAAPTTTTGNLLIEDTESTMGIVSSNINEATSAVAAGDAAGDLTGLFLATTPAATPIGLDRSCTADATAKTATVTLTYSGQETRVKGPWSTVLTASGTESRVWSNTVSKAAIACTKSGKRASINWASESEINGLQLVATVARSNTRKVTFKDSKGNSATTGMSDATTGTRTVNWKATDVTSLTKTSVVAIKHVQTFTKLDGSLTDLSADHATLDGKPLKTTRISDASGNTESYQIESGTMSVNKLGFFYLTTEYNKVLFDLKATDPCTPQSGTITTNIYIDATSTKALKTLVITYKDNVGTVATDTAATEFLKNAMNHSCDFLAGAKI